MVIGMIGAFLFIIIQLILLVDFAHSWNENWIRRHEESDSKIWFIGMHSFLKNYYNKLLYDQYCYCITNKLLSH